MSVVIYAPFNRYTKICCSARCIAVSVNWYNICIPTLVKKKKRTIRSVLLAFCFPCINRVCVLVLYIVYKCFLLQIFSHWQFWTLLVSKWHVLVTKNKIKLVYIFIFIGNKYFHITLICYCHCYYSTKAV